MSIFDVAYEVHVRECQRYDTPPGWPDDLPVPPGLARPFGRPFGMPPHHWVVSRAMMQALTEAAPPPFRVPNSKTTEDITKLLFGWPVDVDADAPPETLRLELSAVGSAVGPESDG